MRIKLLLAIAALATGGIPMTSQRLADKTLSEKQVHADAIVLCGKHPAWKERDCERVARKEIWIGMAAEMLLASQGSPSHTKKVITAAGTTQTWIYEKEMGSVFRDGECVAGCKTEVLYVHIGPTLRIDAIQN